MKLGRRKHSEMSAMFQAYPDSRLRGDNFTTKGMRNAEAAKFAELPRCRCGLLLPCNDCLPEHAPEFQEQRMFREDIGGLPERTDFVHINTSPWLAAKDAEHGRLKGGQYRMRPMLYGAKANG